MILISELGLSGQNLRLINNQLGFDSTNGANKKHGVNQSKQENYESGSTWEKKVCGSHQCGQNNVINTIQIRSTWEWCITPTKMMRWTMVYYCFTHTTQLFWG